jgi:hypothetical protein
MKNAQKEIDFQQYMATLKGQYGGYILALEEQNKN